MANQVTHIVVVDVVEWTGVVDLEMGGRVTVLVVLDPSRTEELVKDLQATHGASDPVAFNACSDEHDAAEANFQEVWNQVEGCIGEVQLLALKSVFSVSRTFHHNFEPYLTKTVSVPSS